MDEQTAIGQTALEANTFTRLGYAFDGWRDKAFLMRLKYPNEAMYSFEKDAVFQAQWICKPYELTIVSALRTSDSTATLSVTTNSELQMIALKASAVDGEQYTEYNDDTKGPLVFGWKTYPIIIEGLEPDTSYEFMVEGKNSADCGAKGTTDAIRGDVAKTESTLKYDPCDQFFPESEGLAEEPGSAVINDGEDLETAADSLRFEVFKDTAKYRFRLRSALDGWILTDGRSFDTMEEAKKNACWVRRSIDGANVVEADS